MGLKDFFLEYFDLHLRNFLSRACALLRLIETFWIPSVNKNCIFLKDYFYDWIHIFFFQKKPLQLVDLQFL